MKGLHIFLRILAVLLGVLIVLSVTPGPVLAQDPTEMSPTSPPTEWPGPFSSPTWEQTVDNGDGTYTFSQVVNGQSTPPHYTGPWYSGGYYGFGYYSWFDQDYGWKHTFPDHAQPNLLILEVTLTIRAWDVDSEVWHGWNGEYDGVTGDGKWLNPQYLQGTNYTWSVTVFNVDPSALLDGELGVWLDIDMHHNVRWWATTLDYSRLDVSYTYSTNNPPYQPELAISPVGCTDTDDDLVVTVTGPTPADPDGDSVTYEYRWLVDTGTGFYVDDEFAGRGNHTGNTVPAADTQTGDRWKVEVTPVDEYGAKGSASEISFETILASCNRPPQLMVDQSAVTVHEGDAASNSGTVSDPDGDSVTLTTSVGIVTNNGDGTWSWTFATDDGPAQSQTVTIDADDGNGGAAQVSFELVVNNIAATATFNAPTDVNEGNDVFLSLTDPYDPSLADTAAGFEYAFDCGDGAGYGSYSSANSAVCPTADNGTRTVRGKIRDKDGGETEYTASVLINNLAPTVGTITVDPTLVQVGTAINASADFTDPGTADTHAAQWDWGDGNVEAGTVTQGAGFGSVADGHAYITPGVYTIVLTVTDDDGGSDTSEFRYVVVYDPSAGFVTGGGWIDSPPGACNFDACTYDTTGKANFGFVSKYKKGAETPTGNTEFQFHAGNLNFHSDAYEWLVIAGATAKFKGTGTINGSGNYGFMLSAKDENLTPSTDVDMFRIKIWDKDNGDAIVYDNEMSEEDDADPTTGIAGGSIVVHTGKK